MGTVEQRIAGSEGEKNFDPRGNVAGCLSKPQASFLEGLSGMDGFSKCIVFSAERETDFVIVSN